MFSIKEAVRYGWEKFKGNYAISIGIFLLMYVVSFLGNLDKDSIILAIAVGVAGTILQIGVNKIFLRISDGEKPEFTDVFKEYKYFWKYLGASILTALATLGGLILLIVPGIIWAVRFSFATLIVIDLNMGPIAAMKESYAITKDKFWKLIVFFLAMVGINLLGAIALLVGLLVTIPISLFAWVYVYRALSKKLMPVQESLTPPATSI